MYTIKVTPNFAHENGIPVIDRSRLPVMANVTLTFNNSFVVEQIQIIMNKQGNDMSIAMPNIPTKTGYKDICSTIKKEFQEELYENIYEVFGAALAAGKTAKANFQTEKKRMSIAGRAALVYSQSYTKAVGSLLIDNCFLIHSIAIKESKSGTLYPDMPSYKTGSIDMETGKPLYKDFCFPATKEAYCAISRVMQKAYQEELQKKTEIGYSSTSSSVLQAVREDFRKIMEQNPPIQTAKQLESNYASHEQAPSTPDEAKNHFHRQGRNR